MNEDKLQLLEGLRNAEEIFVLMSAYTKMPYVVCDEETFDDEVLIFFDEQAAREEASRLINLKNPIRIAKVEKETRLEFFVSLYAIGVNCLRIDKGTNAETTVQHSEIVYREEPKETPEDQMRVENPELHLTALYFEQEYRKCKTPEVPEELMELYEELRAHFERGQYIIVSEEGKGFPMLKPTEDRAFFPIFTDFHEFTKFSRLNKDAKYKVGIAKAENVLSLLNDEVYGIVINPMGVNLILATAK